MRPFPLPLVEGVLLRRYRRFLADVRLPGGDVVTAHCPNPGAMTGCAAPDSAVLLSRSTDPARKLPYTWELVRVGRIWVCVNTAVANRVVRRWLESGHLLPGYGTVRAEVRHADSRFDFALDDRCLVEVKSVTLAVDGCGAFPDAVTKRGRRHLETLARLRGVRRVLLYFVARADVTAVRPADEIDPAYGRALRQAVRAGVEVLAVQARFTRRGVARGPLLQVIV
ncbi:MAG: DNA/RNA nuclease SfsA [Planctomycetota bacterium]